MFEPFKNDSFFFSLSPFATLPAVKMYMENTEQLPPLVVHDVR